MQDCNYKKLNFSSMTTPQNFTKVYKEKYDAIKDDASKINSGLLKLQEAAEDVRVRQEQLKEKELLLVHKQKETDALVKEIEIRTAEAEKQRKEVEAVKEVLAKEAAIVGAWTLSSPPIS